MFGNDEFKLIVMCNLYSIFNGISILKVENLSYTVAKMTGQTSVPFDICWISYCWIKSVSF